MDYVNLRKLGDEIAEQNENSMYLYDDLPEDWEDEYDFDSEIDEE